MKKICIAAVAFISFIIFAFTYQEKTLVGRWETRTPDGTIFGAVFKPDYTYSGYANKKVFVTGKYKFKDNVLAMDDDGGCTTTGTYKVTFFADSLSLSVVTDSCTGRRQGTDKMRFGSVKSK